MYSFLGPFKIGHFRVPPGLCIKIKLSAQPLIWRRFFILMKIKLIIFQGRALGLVLKVRFFWNSEVAYFVRVPQLWNFCVFLC